MLDDFCLWSAKGNVFVEEQKARNQNLLVITYFFLTATKEWASWPVNYFLGIFLAFASVEGREWKKMSFSVPTYFKLPYYIFLFILRFRASRKREDIYLKDGDSHIRSRKKKTPKRCYGVSLTL